MLKIPNTYWFQRIFRYGPYNRGFKNGFIRGAAISWQEGFAAGINVQKSEEKSLRYLMDELSIIDTFVVERTKKEQYYNRQLSKVEQKALLQHLIEKKV